jgi:carbon monoxide dehydrogenase subunit G
VKLEGERSFEAPRQAVWEVLNDPARMAKTMPGVESFDVHDDRHWQANVKIPLGLGVLPLSINFEKTEERPIDYARLRAKGTGVGAMLSMETGFHLSEGGGGTQMRWEADVHITGPVGSMGQRVLQPIVNQQVQHVLTALEEQVREATAGAKPSAEPAATGASAAEEGLHPASPESYEREPEGPTHSTGEAG